MDLAMFRKTLVESGSQLLASGSSRGTTSTPINLGLVRRAFLR